MSGHNSRMESVGKSIREQSKENRKQTIKENKMSLTTRRIEADLPTSTESIDVYYIDHDKLSDEQVRQMRTYKAELIRKYRKLGKKRIGLRCQNTERPIEQLSNKSFVEYMLQHSFPYGTPSKR